MVGATGMNLWPLLCEGSGFCNKARKSAYLSCSVFPSYFYQLASIICKTNQAKVGSVQNGAIGINQSRKGLARVCSRPTVSKNVESTLTKKAL